MKKIDNNYTLYLIAQYFKVKQAALPSVSSFLFTPDPNTIKRPQNPDNQGCTCIKVQKN